MTDLAADVLLVIGRSRRFPGAGGSAQRKFARVRAENMADEWKLWLGGTGLALVFIIWSELTTPGSGRLLDLVAGAMLGVLFVLWSLGGHVSAFRWQLGAMGEQDTGKVIERLGSDWHCEHDVVHAYGNWDHLLVGPPGVFVLDSKLLHGQAVASGDGLRAGRLTYSGLAVRRAAFTVKERLEEQLGQPAGWVQGVVVIWGDFPQRCYEADRVVYVAGEELVDWLSALSDKLNQPQVVARATALRLMREKLLVAEDRV